MPALRDFARGQLDAAERAGLRRRPVVTQRPGGGRVRRDGRELVSFSCNDYLGLAHHPAVIAAARAALERFGAGAGASRLVTGNHPLYAELESLLAEMKGTERALVFGSGYLANVGVIPALVGNQDLILADRLCHACMWDGARLSGATVLRFDHNDVEHCRSLLEDGRRRAGRCLILTETVFSMDGDRGRVAALAELAREYDAWLLTDDAHGLGILPTQPVDLQMGTLSKALGGCGGYVCAASEVIAWLENRARTLMFTTGLPPATVAAAAAALRVLRDEPERRARPLENARLFTTALGRPDAESPIVPVVLGEPARALAASAMLERNGLLVVAIRPPSVPPGTARLRFAFSAMHEPEPIERAAALLKEHGYA
jgi:8-amino-7-oxononanoate synthase